MPEVLKYEVEPPCFREFHIEPFFEEYIPGAVVLFTEKHNDRKVFFQIPKPTFAELSPNHLEVLRNEIHKWWETKGHST